ncbi:CWF19-like protein 2 isoform X2 [Rhineura floridana]|uniref:CWF19-like protein 2 isoform X2 n=1 Tax=Rhineura floridana TaxID=261503 RepID=UPI002AC82217|nr:CWF19-like protein 2 isoform X2 [Rhineura floridana]
MATEFLKQYKGPFHQAQAKADYEKEERRKELKRLRGEDMWMLPDVNERLEELGKEHSVTKKKKKEKHLKKHKKEKRKKHKAKKNNDSSDSPSNSSEEWVEASDSQSSSTEKDWDMKKEQSDAAEDPRAVQRDEWMSLDFMSVKTLSSASLKAEKQMEKLLEKQKAEQNEQALLSERELNPYWKDGGTGLPPQENVSANVTAVEDGGLSWLKKSYQRMKEQSEREKRDLEEIVAERYGSVELFQSRLEEAKKAAVPKENDHRRGWQICKYSRNERGMRQKEEKGKQGESNAEKHADKERSEERCTKEYSQERRSCKRDRPTEEPRQSNKDIPYRTVKESYKIRNYEKPFSSPFRAAFLKPNDDADQGSRLQSPSSQLLTPSSMSCGFRKPSDDVPRWRKTQPKEDIARATLDEKPLNTEMAVTSKEEGLREKQEEIPKGALEKKEPLDSKSSFKGTLDTLSLQSTSSEPTPPVKVAKVLKAPRSVLEDEKPRILSDEEMNKLGAKIVKAELMGNKDLAAKLQTQLDNARKLKENGAQIQARESEREKRGFQEDHEVVLVRTDKSGGVWPVNAPGETWEPTGRRMKQTIATHVDKERVRYFQDDDNLSLKDLVRNEKMRTAEDHNKLFMRMASKFSDKTDREYYTLDDMFVAKAAKGERSVEEEGRQRKQAIREHQQLAAWIEKCPYCFGSPELPKHLIIAIGNKVYLSLPNYQSLTEGHCLIAPMQHHTAATLLDEDIWEEIQVFRKTLVKMFEAHELDCVFLETNLSIKKRYHMVYECVPLPKEMGDMAPIYFKKAIMESDEEWSMNKKLIDISSKDIRKSVPKGLPYFSVDFGLQGGFAHVIEDQHKFPFYFGKEIIGGMLDLEPRLWRKGLRESFEDQRKKVLHFAQMWKPYDFTKNKE